MNLYKPLNKTVSCQYPFRSFWSTITQKPIDMCTDVAFNDQIQYFHFGDQMSTLLSTLSSMVRFAPKEDNVLISAYHLRRSLLVICDLIGPKMHSVSLSANPLSRLMLPRSSLIWLVLWCSAEFYDLIHWLVPRSTLFQNLSISWAHWC